ncbi:MAG: hypothetical protein H0T78_10110 [Longispora sp.]|nr:hypothetical protein [Longispora sp. (in: high G+C Gram-positive bacteria)]
MRLRIYSATLWHYRQLNDPRASRIIAGVCAVALVSFAFIPSMSADSGNNSRTILSAAVADEDQPREIDPEKASRSNERTAPELALAEPQPELALAEPQPEPALAELQPQPALAEPQPEPAPAPPPPAVDVWDSPPPVVPPVAGLNQDQMNLASTIVWEGGRLGLPTDAKVIAVATALQETNLRNMANHNVDNSFTMPYQGVGSDHDSVGPFQQRPQWPEGNGSWGAVWELMTPAISAQKFYHALMRINWQGLPVSVAAQRVQVSAYPDAYAKHEGRARQIVQALQG